MATQQHPAFDPNQPLPPDGALRSSGWKKDYCGSASRRSGKVHYGQLWLGAILEAQSWKSREENSRIPAFEVKWEKTKESIEAGTQALRNLTSSGNKLQGDGEILLGNSTGLHQALQQTKQPVRKARTLPQIHADESTILPRAYAAVASYLQAVNYEFDEETFEQYFTALQETVAFEMRELWQLQPFAKLVLLESVAALTDRMDAATYLRSEDSTKTVEAVATEYFGSPSLSTLMVSMRRIDGADWNEVFERVNAVERILRLDPCDAYASMDFESRENYRQTIAQLAKRAEASEQEVARKAVELARPIHASSNARVRQRQSHVGYYLQGEGRKELEKTIAYRPTLAERTQRFLKRWPDFSYILGIELFTLALMAAVVLGAKPKVSGWIVVALFLLPAAECAVALVNQLATTLFQPKALPKLDFSKGVPAEFTTMVAVPTLLTSEEQMGRAVRDLEIRFLANRDANIHFALLTDPPDAGQQFDDKDKLADQCAHLIEAMNARYAGEGKGSFFLFHRHRAYNPAEGHWMGWERKRGKLLDFNKLLLGASTTAFPVKAGHL